MHRPLQKMLISVATIAVVLVGLITPASAQTDAVSDVKGDAVTDVAEIRPIDFDEVEKLRFRCGGRLDRDEMPGVLCRWSRPTADDAAYLTLERNGGDGWATIYRSENLRRNRFFDEKVEPGQRYRYRVRVYNVDHELVAAARTRAATPPLPDFEIMRLACKGSIDDTGAKAARCEWSQVDDARGYQVWRIVNRGHRELVGTFGPDALATRDELPEEAKVVRYAVLALDEEGEIIGRSRVNKVRFIDGID
ncbi:MAG: hypothetical protein ACR2P0_02025 [Acidimicrobiales bacterium]